MYSTIASAFHWISTALPTIFANSHWSCGRTALISDSSPLSVHHPRVVLNDWKCDAVLSHVKSENIDVISRCSPVVDQNHTVACNVANERPDAICPDHPCSTSDHQNSLSVPHGSHQDWYIALNIAPHSLRRDFCASGRFSKIKRSTVDDGVPGTMSPKSSALFSHSSLVFFLVRSDNSHVSQTAHRAQTRSFFHRHRHSLSASSVHSEASLHQKIEDMSFHVAQSHPTAIATLPRFCPVSFFHSSLSIRFQKYSSKTHSFFSFVISLIESTPSANAIFIQCAMSGSIFFQIDFIRSDHPLIAHSIWASSGLIVCHTAFAASIIPFGVFMLYLLNSVYNASLSTPSVARFQSETALIIFQYTHHTHCTATDIHTALICLRASVSPEFFSWSYVVYGASFRLVAASAISILFAQFAISVWYWSSSASVSVA